MAIVIDCGVLAAYYLHDEPLHRQAEIFFDRLGTGANPPVAPRLLRSEIVAVVRKAAFTNRISHDRSIDILGDVFGLPIRLYDDDELMYSALEIAHQYMQPRTYDAQYLALTTRLGAQFWTADLRLVNSVQRTFPLIRWLGEVS